MAGPSQPMRLRIGALEELSSLPSGSLPLTDWVRMSQNRIQRFADCNEDRQWIHVDPVRARSGPFGSTIAHGFLTLSMLTKMLDDVLDTSAIPFVINYGLDRIRFPAPVPSDSCIRGQFTVRESRQVGAGIQVTFDVAIMCDAQIKPVCVATLLLRYYDAMPQAMNANGDGSGSAP